MRKNLLIFLIDDDADDQEIFVMALQQIDKSIQYIFANDGIHAIEKLHDNSFLPDVIFVDINMPRMDGIQCLLEIRKLPQVKHVPVYMYSTSGEQSIIEKCLKIGAAGFLKKKINVDDLQKQLMKILTAI